MSRASQRAEANRRRIAEETKTLNMARLRAYRGNWDWKTFALGGPACLKWSFRDLHNLDAALLLFTGRRECVQAGGNLGIFPKRLAEEFQKVYTFEPDPKLYMQTCVTAPEKNVLRRQAALGCERRGISVECKRRDASGRPSHEGLTHVAGLGSIEQLLIDDLHLTACDLIYLDIEGYEFNALRGAVETIARCRPVIGVEINRNIAYYGNTGDELRSWIESYGYKRVLTMNSDEVFVPT